MVNQAQPNQVNNEKNKKKQYHFNKIIDEVTRYQKPSSGSFLET
jgi:hypothetical protein